MPKLLLIFVCITLNLSLCDGALEIKDYVPMRTSVIIPCHHIHFDFISELLECYKEQTRLPDEIIISLTLNQVDKIPQKDIEDVQYGEWPFDVKIVYDDGEQLPGSARNCACENSTGDIIICQDADDIPHPQRTEIIANLFENYESDFLIHRWIRYNQPFKLYTEMDTLSLATYFDEYYDISFDFIHNGNIALRREVFDYIKWQPFYQGEDIEFNMEVFEKFNYKVGLDEYLMIYRFELSSFKYREESGTAPIFKDALTGS